MKWFPLIRSSADPETARNGLDWAILNWAKYKAELSRIWDCTPIDWNGARRKDYPRIQRDKKGALIERVEEILGSEEKRTGDIKTELNEVKDRYADARP